jgi:hypothetical protein
LRDDPNFVVVLGIVAGEDNLGLPPFESGCLDEGTYTFSRRAMTCGWRIVTGEPILPVLRK